MFEYPGLTDEMRIAVTAESNLTQLTTPSIIRKNGTPIENIRNAIRQLASNLSEMHEILRHYAKGKHYYY